MVFGFGFGFQIESDGMKVIELHHEESTNRGSHKEGSDKRKEEEVEFLSSSSSLSSSSLLGYRVYCENNASLAEREGFPFQQLQRPLNISCQSFKTHEQHREHHKLHVDDLNSCSSFVGESFIRPPVDICFSWRFGLVHTPVPCSSAHQLVSFKPPALRLM